MVTDSEMTVIALLGESGGQRGSCLCPMVPHACPGGDRTCPGLSQCSCLAWLCFRITVSAVPHGPAWASFRPLTASVLCLGAQPCFFSCVLLIMRALLFVLSRNIISFESTRWFYCSCYFLPSYWILWRPFPKLEWQPSATLAPFLESHASCPPRCPPP